MPACLLRLRPFAPAAFAAFIATMASADFCPSLNGQTPPGKVHGLSGRAVGLYPVRLSATVGFRVSQHTHRSHPASLSVPVRTVVPSIHPLPARQSPAAPWASLARVVVTTSGNLLPDCQSMPMPGTLGLGATLVVARIGEVRFRRQRDGTSPSPTTRCSLHVRVPTRGGEPGWSVQSVMSRCQYSSPSRRISARVASFHDASPK